MSALVIVDLTIHDTARFQEYVELVPDLIEKHHGKYLVRGGKVEVREGSWQPERLVVLEFPSVAAARSFLDDPDYQPIAAIRHAAASTNLVIAEECQLVPSSNN